MQQGRVVRGRILLIIFGLFLFSVVLECALRAGGAVVTSLQACHNRKMLSKAGAYRIMCIGESTTDLGGVDSYPSQLQEVLNQSGLGIRFSVINKGMNGTISSAIVDELESDISMYHPQLVITMMGINDYGKHIPFVDSNPSIIGKCLGSLRIYKLLCYMWLRIKYKIGCQGDYFSAGERRKTELFEAFPGARWNCYADDGIDEQTEEELRKAIEVHPLDSMAYVSLGYFFKDRKVEFAESEEAFKKALTINHQNEHAYVGLGLLYGIQQQSSQAEQTFMKAIEINPKNDEAYLCLAWLYAGQRKIAKAEELFMKSIAVKSTNDKAFYGLGVLYKQGRAVESAQAFRKAVEINPLNDRAYFELGLYYKDQKMYKEVEEAFSKALKANPMNDKVYGGLVSLSEEMDKENVAKSYFKQAKILRAGYYNYMTLYNYRKVRKILEKSGIRFVCVQYPMRSLEVLKKMVGTDGNVVFVDNEKLFIAIILP